MSLYRLREIIREEIQEAKSGLRKTSGSVSWGKEKGTEKKASKKRARKIGKKDIKDQDLDELFNDEAPNPLPSVYHDDAVEENLDEVRADYTHALAKSWTNHKGTYSIEDSTLRGNGGWNNNYVPGYPSIPLSYVKWTAVKDREREITHWTGTVRPSQGATQPVNLIIWND